MALKLMLMQVPKIRTGPDPTPAGIGSGPVR
jgi:hypothetical protein